MYVRHIDAFLSLDHTAVLHLAQQFVILLSCDKQIYGTVIDEDMGPYRYVVHEFGACSIEDLGIAEPVRSVVYFDPVPFLHYKPHGRLHCRQADLRSFGIHQNAYPVGNGTDIVHYFLRTFQTCMCGIDPDHVHAVLIQLAQEIRIAVYI